MSLTSDFYFTQALRNERVAEDAALDNVRECHLRSARAWRTLAERLRHAEAHRAEDAARKALRETVISE